ncbi:hypothetical protein J6590_085708, partial [Homalodisca vitripennis]
MLPGDDLGLQHMSWFSGYFVVLISSLNNVHRVVDSLRQHVPTASCLAVIWDCGT